MLEMKTFPPLQWGQDSSYIYITISAYDSSVYEGSTPLLLQSTITPPPTTSTPTEFPNVISERASLLNPEHISVLVEGGNILNVDFCEKKYTMPLAHSVSEELKKPPKLVNGGISLILVKEQKGVCWESLMDKSIPKNQLRNIKIDWKYWKDEQAFSSDEPESYLQPSSRSLKVLTSPPIEIKPSDTISPPTDCPSLNKIWEEEHSSFLLKTLSAGQRMLTLLHFWNFSQLEDRKVILSNFTKNGRNEKFNRYSAMVKGGAELLEDISCAAYEAHGVVECAKWAQEFAEMCLSDKLCALNHILEVLPSNELELVYSTFS